MITAQDSIPKKSDSFLRGVDILYTQFNDVNFYIEDENQENFYYQILRKLFPDIRINRIFPLRGKDNVLKKIRYHKDDKNKIFIVDKDFDDLLGKKVRISNLFYLRQYSIENYLIDIDSIKEYIIEEKPKLLQKNLSKFNFNTYIHGACSLLNRLTILYILIQDSKLGLKNTDFAIDTFVNFKPIVNLKDSEINRYERDIQAKLSSIDKRYKLNAQLRKIKKKFNLYRVTDILIHIPGKYLIKYIKSVIENKYNIPNRNTDSFIFRLAKNNKFENLSFLKQEIISFRSRT